MHCETINERMFSSHITTLFWKEVVWHVALRVKTVILYPKSWIQDCCNSTQACNSQRPMLWGGDLTLSSGSCGTASGYFGETNDQKLKW